MVWPDTSFYSISNTNLDDIQYQVSSYTGVLALALIYWAQENKRVMTYVSMACLAACVVLELSFRISYCTGTLASADIFAAVLIAHLFSSLNKVWCGRLDKWILEGISEYWEKKQAKL